MMAQPYKFLGISTVVFKVLAWVAMVGLVIAGLFLVIVGGEDINIGGFALPARLMGVIYFVQAGTSFFSMWLISNLIQLLLDIRAQLPVGQVRS